jgi:hypothetical protein
MTPLTNAMARPEPLDHASAFAAATVLQCHLRLRAAVPTYTFATDVAMSRRQTASTLSAMSCSAPRSEPLTLERAG